MRLIGRILLEGGVEDPLFVLFQWRFARVFLLAGVHSPSSVATCAWIIHRSPWPGDTKFLVFVIFLASVGIHDGWLSG
jgi:hypothetical protein